MTFELRGRTDRLLERYIRCRDVKVEIVAELFGEPLRDLALHVGEESRPHDLRVEVPGLAPGTGGAGGEPQPAVGASLQEVQQRFGIVRSHCGRVRPIWRPRGAGALTAAAIATAHEATWSSSRCISLTPLLALRLRTADAAAQFVDLAGGGGRRLRRLLASASCLVAPAHRPPAPPCGRHVGAA